MATAWGPPLTLRLPPLRERPGDIVALAEFFAKK